MTTKSKDRYRLYRDGAYGFAFNPNQHRWEVYNLDANGEPYDLICSLQRRGMVAEAIKNLKDLDVYREEMRKKRAQQTAQQPSRHR